jgi:SET domain-containing protein
MLEIRNIPGKGRGVFSTQKFKPGQLIEVCPVIVCPPRDRKHIDKTFLFNYYFQWEDNEKFSAIALGYGSLYNHSYHANARYDAFYEEQQIEIYAHRLILPGDEITINYNADPDCEDKVWFDKIII